jgi:hypothetical protein
VTAELVELDERRDQAITGITQLLRAYQYHFDPIKVAAANRLCTPSMGGNQKGFKSPVY